MVKILENPDFRDEDEEARWWESNSSLLLHEFEEAAANGSLGRGQSREHNESSSPVLLLDSADLALARKQAEHRGLRYQAYLQILLHQALMQQEQQDGILG